MKELFLFVSLVRISHAALESQLVRDLPDQPLVKFKQYAGRIPVSHGQDEKQLFYWFYEADHPNPSPLPLIVWLNGGPGCSSVGAGALNEIGPFRVDKNLQLTLNPYSWNKDANIIFLDSPAGVGFSIAKNSVHFSDDLTARDILSFLLEWFNKFPEYKSNEFYITGESYAGHYIPTLALKILAHNAQNVSRIHFKGFAIGNPLTNVQDEALEKLNFYVSHSIISKTLYTEAIQSCNFSSFSSSNTRCTAAQAEILKQSKHIDRYNAYGKVCKSTSDDCTKFSALYLNRKSVQVSLNLGTNVSWASCNTLLKSQYSAIDRNASMIPLYQQLLKAGIRIWIYSGDFDIVVPTLSTQAWISRLNLDIKIPWYAWKYDNQVGGWSEVYSGLTFTTVRGAGHRVPADQPGPSRQIFQRFLHNKPLPVFSELDVIV